LLIPVVWPNSPSPSVLLAIILHQYHSCSQYHHRDLSMPSLELSSAPTTAPIGTLPSMLSLQHNLALCQVTYSIIDLAVNYV